MSANSPNDTLRRAQSIVARSARDLASLLSGSTGAAAGDFDFEASEILRLLPSDLRPADATLFHQARQGVVRLAGHSINLGTGTLFDVNVSAQDFQRAAHGFTWLNDLRAAGTDDAGELARDWAIAWLIKGRRRFPIALETDVRARRILSWLSHADILLDDVDDDVEDAIYAAMTDDIRACASRWRQVPSLDARVTTLLAVLAGATALAHCERFAEGIRDMAGEVFCQLVQEDGSHVSRNPARLIPILLDALPVARACDALDRPLPEAIARRCENALRHLSAMRLGASGLARFNGVGTPPRAEVSRLWLLGAPLTSIEPARTSEAGGYVHFNAGQIQLIVDAGPLPANDHAHNAHAGCLSFELAVAGQPVIVNAGAPAPMRLSPDQLARQVTRARASDCHSTLTLANASSSRIDPASGEIAGVDQVVRHVSETQNELALIATHNGYVAPFGLAHTRTITVCASGTGVWGSDELGSPGEPVRFAQDLPLAVRFHIHPANTVTREHLANAATIALPNGARCRISCEKAQLSIEDSTFFADAAGPQPCQQVVLRGTTHGETTLTWQLEISQDG